MKVTLLPGSHLVLDDQEYKAGDTVELSDQEAKVQIEAGIVEAVKSKKEKK